MGQLVLTEDQKTVLGMIGREQNLAGFYLSGGTALAAYYFEHRFSDDLDFFTEDEIDSLRDISANKLMAMLDRFDPKDFVDLYFILQKTDIHKLKSDSEKKFGAKIDPLFLGGELAKARRIRALPRMIKDLDLDNLKSFFEKLSKTLKPNIF